MAPKSCTDMEPMSLRRRALDPGARPAPVSTVGWDVMRSEKVTPRVGAGRCPATLAPRVGVGVGVGLGPGGCALDPAKKEDGAVVDGRGLAESRSEPDEPKARAPLRSRSRPLLLRWCLLRWRLLLLWRRRLPDSPSSAG